MEEGGGRHEPVMPNPAEWRRLGTPPAAEAATGEEGEGASQPASTPHAPIPT